MTGIDVVAHKAACASLVARGQMLLITRYQGALFGFPSGVARCPRCPLCFLAVGGYEGVKAGGLGLLALRRGATFFAAGRGRDGFDGRRGLVAVVFVLSKHAPRLADRPPAVHCHGLPWAYG